MSPYHKPLQYQNLKSSQYLNPEHSKSEQALLEARKTRALLKEEHKAFVKAQKLKRRYYIDATKNCDGKINDSAH